MGRLIETDYDGSLLVATTFVNGRPATTSWGNGLVQNWSFDPGDGSYAGSALTRGPAGPVVLQDAVAKTGWNIGNGVGSVARVAMTASAAGYSDGKTYDISTSDGSGDIHEYPDGALVDVEDACPACPSVPNETYGYDVIGNISTHVIYDGGTPQQTTFAVIHNYNPEHNRLLSITGDPTGPNAGQTLLRLTWDVAGYVTSITGADGNTLPVSFDAAGQVTQIGASTATRDLDGRPISFQLQLPGGSSDTKTFAFGGEMESGADPVLLVAGVHLENPTRRYLYADGRGNVIAVLDESGNVVGFSTYSGFATQSTAGPDTENHNRFASGIEFGGGLELLGRRLYHQLAGQFLQPDPVYQIINQFAYARGNPVLLTDRGGAEVEMTDKEADDALAGGERTGRSAAGAAMAGIPTALAAGAFWYPPLGISAAIAVTIFGWIWEPAVQHSGDDGWWWVYMWRLDFKQQTRNWGKAATRYERLFGHPWYRPVGSGGGSGVGVGSGLESGSFASMGYEGGQGSGPPQFPFQHWRWDPEFHWILGGVGVGASIPGGFGTGGGPCGFLGIEVVPLLFFYWLVRGRRMR